MPWFRTNYPKIKPNTVNAQVILATTNSKTRTYYNATPKNDLFFQIDSGHLRLYDPASDPTPIYADRQDPASDLEAGESANDLDHSAVDEDRGEEFAYESDLKNYLASNLSLIERGLRLFDKLEGISALEFPVGSRYIDILALDTSDNPVVIGLKVSRGYDRVVGQLLRYMAWIERHIAKPPSRVRGVIIASSISEDLVLACSRVT